MWRATLLSAVLAALAGCSVETEGAACGGLGDDDACPSGQACGIDGRCAVDPVTDCPAPGEVIGVDPEASGNLEGGGTITPTGWDSLPGCRLPTLAAGLAAAGSRTVTVLVHEQTAPLEVPLTTTLVLPGNVKLTTDVAAPDKFVLRAVTGFPAAGEIVRLEPGATLEGFTVTTDVDTTGAAVAVGTVAVPCGSATPSTLARLRLLPSSGGTPRRFDRGLVVVGDCVVVANDVEVAGAAREGVYVLPVAAPAALPQLTFTGGLVRESGATGVRVRGGKLVVTGTEITANTVHGIFAEWLAADRAFDVQVAGADIHANEGVGLFARDLAAAAGSRLVVTASSLRNNSGVTSAGYASGRRAGGVLLWGDAMLAASFTFRGNTVCSNGGNAADEIGVFGTGSPNWRLGASAAAQCSTEGNRVFDAASGAVLIWGIDDVNLVLAQFNYWFSLAGGPPPAGSINNADISDPCGQLTSAPPGC